MRGRWHEASPMIVSCIRKFTDPTPPEHTTAKKREARSTFYSTNAMPTPSSERRREAIEESRHHPNPQPSPLKKTTRKRKVPIRRQVERNKTNLTGRITKNTSVDSPRRTKSLPELQAAPRENTLFSMKQHRRAALQIHRRRRRIRRSPTLPRCSRGPKEPAGIYPPPGN